MKWPTNTAEKNTELSAKEKCLICALNANGWLHGQNDASRAVVTWLRMQKAHYLRAHRYTLRLKTLPLTFRCFLWKTWAYSQTVFPLKAIFTPPQRFEYSFTSRTTESHASYLKDLCLIKIASAIPQWKRMLRITKSQKRHLPGQLMEGPGSKCRPGRPVSSPVRRDSGVFSAGSAAKGWAGTVISAPWPPQDPSARAEFTCNICSGN